MDEVDLWEYFQHADHYVLKPKKAMAGFMPDWIGAFYAYCQWYYNLLGAEVVKKIPLDFLMKKYHRLHDLDLELAVRKVGGME